MPRLGCSGLVSCKQYSTFHQSCGLVTAWHPSISKHDLPSGGGQVMLDIIFALTTTVYGQELQLLQGSTVWHIMFYALILLPVCR
mmetsp:Transcript_11348/g.19859  ORF Transcript_11348/g.19859 Transcript_11348/m.19859 type:complete len:85 (-) Transcript_11348:257-511(-)